MFFLAEKLGKTVSQLEHELTPDELTQWHVYFDPEYWRNKINNTEQGRSAQIMHLIMGSKNV